MDLLLLFIYSLKRTENKTTLTAQNAKKALPTFKPIQMVSSFDLKLAPIIINYNLFFNDCLDHKLDYLIGLIQYAACTASKNSVKLTRHEIRIFFHSIYNLSKGQ